MKTIIGYGNNLRGEDAFGVDVINQLQKCSKDNILKNTKLISTFQLTPELCLELLDSSKIIFIDALYSNKRPYLLACSLEKSISTNLSHNISPEIIISMLENLYNHKIEYEIYSMTTCNFEKILDEKKYETCVNKVFEFIKNS